MNTLSIYLHRPTLLQLPLQTYLFGALLLIATVGCHNERRPQQPLTFTEQNALDTSYAITSHNHTTHTAEDDFHQQIRAYESKDRVFWQKPELVISKMGELSDKVVADIGAGSGYFARRLAMRAQRVIAIDIDPRFIHFMDSLKMVEQLDRFETRLAEPMDPHLKPQEVDIVLMVNTYLYLPQRVNYLKHLKKSIKPGGRIFIIDFKKKKIPITDPPAHIRIPLYQVEQELEQAGYRIIESDDTSLDYQYIVVAERP